MVAAAGRRRAGRDPGRPAGPAADSVEVGPAGSVLVGHVNGLAPAALVRATFTAWEAALALGERREDRLGGGAAWCTRVPAVVM